VYTHALNYVTIPSLASKDPTSIARRSITDYTNISHSTTDYHHQHKAMKILFHQLAVSQCNISSLDGETNLKYVLPRWLPTKLASVVQKIKDVSAVAHQSTDLESNLLRVEGGKK
jgi:hypothetical protein